MKQVEYAKRKNRKKKTKQNKKNNGDLRKTVIGTAKQKIL